IVRSEKAHAEIIDIETSKAKKVPGVYDVITGKDISNNVPRFGPIIEDQPILADKLVKYHGEPIAIVLAEDEISAKHALDYIEVVYKELPPVTTIEQSLSDQAPKISEFAKEGSNIFDEWKYGWGNVTEAEKSSY